MNFHAACKRCERRPLQPGADVLAKELALDLGTSNTRLYVRGHGIAVDQPTVALVDLRTNRVTAVGLEALSSSVDPGTKLVRPIVHGTVADGRVLEEYLGHLLRPYKGGLLDRQRMVVSVASASSPIERRIVRESLQAAGSDRIHVIEHVLAAALGSDLPLHEPVGSMVVDVGGGITEVALLSLGAVVAASSVRSGGMDVDKEIQSALRREYVMAISDRGAEEIKIAGSSFVQESAPAFSSGPDAVSPDAPDDDQLIEARGTSLLDDSSMTAILEGEDLGPLLRQHWQSVVEAIHATLIQAPPELGQDLFSRGIHLVGGAAKAPALARQVHSAFGIPVAVVNEPQAAVIRGAAKCLEAPEAFSDLFLGERGLT